MSDTSVRALYFDLLKAWNERDAARFAALFTEHGQTVGFDGSTTDGPASIASHLRPIFESHPTAKFVAKVRHIQFIHEDVAVLGAVAGMIPPGGTDIMEARNTIQSLVAARTGEHWRIVLFQNTPATFDGRPQDRAALTEELRTLLPEKR